MKYLKWIALTVVILVVLTFIGAIVALNSDSVHRNLEAKISASSGFDTHLGRFGWAFPLRISVAASKLTSPTMEVEFEEASFSLTRFLPPFGIDLAVHRPRVNMVAAASEDLKGEPPKDAKLPAKAEEAGTSGGGGLAAVPPMRLSLRVTEGEVATASASISHLDFKFVQSSLLRSPASVTIDALVKAGPLPAPLPLHLETDSLTLEPTKVAADNVNARVAGITANVAGRSDLEANKHQWKLDVDAPDLKKIPAPAGDVKDWAGAVKAAVKVEKSGETLDADGDIQASDVTATLASKRAGAELHGPMKASLEAKFGFHGGKLALPKGSGAFDLGGVAITYGDTFKKPKDVALSAAFDASGTGEQVNVSRLEARLGDLKLTGGGKAATAAPFNGHIDLNVTPVQLAALKEMLPPLAKQPIEGSISFKGGLEGPLATTNKVRVQIDRFGLDGPLGTIAVSGKVTEATSPKGPKVDLAINATPLRLEATRVFVPAMKELIPNGEVRGRVTLNGSLDMRRPWNEWPLDVGGDVSAKIPEYKVADSPAAPAAKAAPAKPETKGSGAPAKAAGFLPKGYLTEHIRMKLAGDIARVKKGPLTITGVGARGEIANAYFRGEASVGQIFNGSVKAVGLSVPLVEPRPTIGGDVSFSNIVIEQAVGFAKPEFKEFATGIIAGRSKFKTRLPEDPDFMNGLEAEGNANAQPVTLNQVKIGEILNNSVGKIPGISLPKVKMTPLHGQVTAQFSVSKGTADLPGILARDVDNSELNAKGKVRLSDLNGDLSGTFAWAGSGLSGCIVDANSDGKKRIIIPLAIKGNLMNPGFSVLGDAISKFGAKAAECEGKKLLDKASKEGLDGLKKEGGKLLKGLFGK